MLVLDQIKEQTPTKKYILTSLNLYVNRPQEP